MAFKLLEMAQQLRVASAGASRRTIQEWHSCGERDDQAPEEQTPEIAASSLSTTFDNISAQFMSDKAEREKEYQAEYYRKNKERLREYRRKKYKEDPEYRRKAEIRETRNYWYKHRTTVELPKLDFEDVQPRGQIQIVVDRPGDPKNGEVQTVNVYGTRQLGQILDRNEQTIRKWIKEGHFPEPSIRGLDLPEGHELRRGRSLYLYTEDQTRTIFDARNLLAIPYSKIESSVFLARVRKEFERMPQGLNQFSGES